jgi:hypothetical protein
LRLSFGCDDNRIAKPFEIEGKLNYDSLREKRHLFEISRSKLAIIREIPEFVRWSDHPG